MCVSVGEERKGEGGNDSQACSPPNESEERETGRKASLIQREGHPKTAFYEPFRLQLCRYYGVSFGFLTPASIPEIFISLSELSRRPLKGLSCFRNILGFKPASISQKCVL